MHHLPRPGYAEHLPLLPFCACEQHSDQSGVPLDPRGGVEPDLTQHLSVFGPVPGQSTLPVPLFQLQQSNPVRQVWPRLAQHVNNPEQVEAGPQQSLLV